MLIHSKPRKKPGPVLVVVETLIAATLALFCLYLSAHGALTGEVDAFSKFDHTTILAVSNPTKFWLAVALWAVAGIFLLFVAFDTWRSR